MWICIQVCEYDDLNKPQHQELNSYNQNGFSEYR